MTENQQQELAEAPANAPSDPSLAMRILRMVWERRRHVAKTIYATGHALAWLYDKFPLPRRVKDITTELFYHAIEHFVVQSESYQNWLHRSQGLTRLHGLFRTEPHEVPAKIAAPTDAQWSALIDAHKPNKGDAKAVVIVPVYKGYDETLTCLYSVLHAKNDAAFELLVINDASPDKALAARLEKLANKGLFTLTTHERNQGFVRTVNEGMQHKDYLAYDVVLLNADTQVYDHWLDRMIAALYHDNSTASATPFSNNAELTSYPSIFRSNLAPLEIDYASLDKLASHANKSVAVEIPTAVGFCMIMRRDAIAQVGYFDDDTFGRGYGEENDWCLRATDEGWRHVLAADTFVYHAGSVSFEANKRRELKRSLRRLNQRHPNYRELVRRFRDEDPLKPVRQQLDLARLQYLGGNRSFLMISHNAGGGTERHIQDMTTRLEREGVTCYRLSPDPEHASRLRLWHEDAAKCPNLMFDLDDEQSELFEALGTLSIEHIHVHHLIGFPERMVHLVPMLSEHLNCQYDVTIHDYYFACPGINLIYESGMYEADPTIEASQQWARHHPTTAGRMPIWLWRHQHELLLKQARRVLAPSNDCAKRMQRFFPAIDVFVRPHPEDTIMTQSLYLRHSVNHPIDVAIIGHLTKHKGAAVILEMAKDAKRRNLPIHFHIFGEADDASALKRTEKVSIYGAYKEGEIYNLLASHRCHIALFASVWPETYSYTLSIALRANILPVCFDLGAPAERIRQSQWGTVLPLHAMKDVELTNQLLLSIQADTPPNDLLDRTFTTYPSVVQHYYGFRSDSISPLHIAPVKG